MSHFVFGVVAGVRPPTREPIDDATEVVWGTQLQQAVVLEILANHGKPSAYETVFSVSTPGEDHADALVSPYQVDREHLVNNLLSILSWLDQVRAGKDAELWTTEGFDDAFEILEGHGQQLGERVRDRLLASEDLPSLRLRPV